MPSSPVRIQPFHPSDCARRSVRLRPPFRQIAPAVPSDCARRSVRLRPPFSNLSACTHALLHARSSDAPTLTHAHTHVSAAACARRHCERCAHLARHCGRPTARHPGRQGAPRRWMGPGANGSTLGR
eukprot:6195609-Pleurochrysis_carterae.AAC.2